MGLFKSIFKSKEEKKGLGASLMRIYVYRLQGNTPVKTGSFLARQEKDKNQNIVLVNEQADFKEDLFVSRDALVSFITDRLKSSGNSKEQQLEALRKKIESQRTIIQKTRQGEINVSDIPLDSELKAIVDDEDKELLAQKKPKLEKVKLNIIDEEERLRLYRVAKYLIENEGEGWYETVDDDQLRCMHFVSQDGVLYPYFWKSNREKGELLTIFLDSATRRKYYKSEDDLIEEERKRDMANKVGQVLKIIGIIALCLMFCVNVFWSIQNSKQANELMAKWDKSAIQQLVNGIDGSKLVCTEAISSQVESNSALIDFAKIKIQQEIDQQQKNDTSKQIIKKI